MCQRVAKKLFFSIWICCPRNSINCNLVFFSCFCWKFDYFFRNWKMLWLLWNGICSWQWKVNEMKKTELREKEEEIGRVNQSVISLSWKQTSFPKSNDDLMETKCTFRDSRWDRTFWVQSNLVITNSTGPPILFVRYNR
jgi:hypothetical protein